jgi:hypothetical protein
MLISSHLHLDLQIGFFPSGSPIQYHITKNKNKTSAKSSGSVGSGHFRWHDQRDRTRPSIGLR